MSACKERRKQNLIDWVVYFGFTMVLISPWFYNSYLKWICLSLLISFFAGMGNRIIRELDKLNKNKNN